MMTIDKDRFTFRIPKAYSNALQKDASAIGVTKTAVLMTILSEKYGRLDEEKNEKEKESSQ